MSTQAFIETIINNAISVGNQKSREASTMAWSAINAATSWTSGSLDFPQHTFRDVEPRVTIPQNAAGIDGAMYNSTYDRIMADFTNRFGDFFAEFFPDECDTLVKAQEWMCRVLMEGGSGVRPEIERQIWQRDRDRITQAANTAGETVLETFAARGFPLPTGAAQHQIRTTQQMAFAEIANSSRAVAIRQMEMELENIKFVVSNAIDYRTKGIAAAGDYIRVLSLAPQIASTMSTAAANAQAQLITAASTYYDSRLQVEKMRLDLRNNDLAIRQERSRHGVDTNMGRARLRAEIMASLAQSLGTQAAAALNAVHAQAGATLNDSL